MLLAVKGDFPIIVVLMCLRRGDGFNLGKIVGIDEKKRLRLICKNTVSTLEFDSGASATACGGIYSSWGTI